MANFHCYTCDRAFTSQGALNQHLNDSRAHASTFDCDPCDRAFSSQKALDQHLNDSPAHIQTFECNPCDRTFVSEEALSQHLNDSPAHVQTFECNPCDRTFVSEEALNQHLRDSPLHQRLSDTPLNFFFRSFPTFEYDPSLAPSISYKRLQQHMCWQRGDHKSDEAWNDYQDALKNELQKWYGSEDDLTAWHALCSAIGIEPLPLTCELCEKVRLISILYYHVLKISKLGRTANSCQHC